MPTHIRTRLVPVAALVLTVFAACAPAEPGEPGEPPGHTVTVAATALGDILADADGMTLYVLEEDYQDQPTCDGECAQAWPPLTVVAEPTSSAGITHGLLDTVERADGSVQVTYNRWPLYRRAADDGPGDTSGHGVDGRWWVISADGLPQWPVPDNGTGVPGGY